MPVNHTLDFVWNKTYDECKFCGRRGKANKIEHKERVIKLRLGPYLLKQQYTLPAAFLKLNTCITLSF